MECSLASRLNTNQFGNRIGFYHIVEWFPFWFRKKNKVVVDPVPPPHPLTRSPAILLQRRLRRPYYRH